MQHSIPFPVLRPGDQGRGSSLIREGNEEKAALLCFPSSAAVPCPVSPPLEMILHRTRLDGAISPMKSILFLGPFSLLSFEGGRRENRRAVAEEEEKPDEIGKGGGGKGSRGEREGAEREFIGAQFSAE